MEEIWKDVPGVRDCQASSMGRIRMKARDEAVTRYDGIVYTRHRQVKYQSQNTAPVYNQVSVNDITYQTHRLVVLAFYGPPPFEKAVVNHKDGNKRNNYADNLEWCTSSHNELHSYHVLGKRPWNAGKSFVNVAGIATRRINQDIKNDRTSELRKSGMSVAQIAKELGISRTQVYTRITNAQNKEA
jgi:hypothetical protein